MAPCVILPNHNSQHPSDYSSLLGLIIQEYLKIDNFPTQVLKTKGLYKNLLTLLSFIFMSLVEGSLPPSLQEDFKTWLEASTS